MFLGAGLYSTWAASGVEEGQDLGLRTDGDCLMLMEIWRVVERATQSV